MCTNVTNIYQHETTKYPFNVKSKIAFKEEVVKEAEKVEECTCKGEFIIWSPQGSRNPKGKHTCKKVATKVAVEMAIKYNQDFYVCKLVVKAKPLKKARITQL